MQVPFKEGDAALHRDQWRGGGEVDGDDGDYRGDDGDDVGDDDNDDDMLPFIEINGEEVGNMVVMIGMMMVMIVMVVIVVNMEMIVIEMMI